MENKKIEMFWKEFISIVKDIEHDYTSPTSFQKIDRLVDDIGPYSWEIGPSSNDVTDFSFTISPNMEKSLLEETKHIISFAPKLPNWSFYHAMQPKIGWEMTFLIRTNNGSEFKINGSDWKYVLYEYDDGKFDIVIKNPLISGLSLDDLYTAAEILIKGIIGEELFITRINEIEIINYFDNEIMNKESLIKNLSNHINKLH